LGWVGFLGGGVCVVFFFFFAVGLFFVGGGGGGGGDFLACLRDFAMCVCVCVGMTHLFSVGERTGA